MLLPALILAAGLLDVVLGRWRFGTVRLVLFVVAYLWIGVGAQLWGAALWIRHGFGRTLWTEAAQRRSHRMIRWWIESMMVALRVVGIRVEWTGDDVPESGPLLMLARHESLADVYIPTRFILLQQRIIRVVLAAGLRNEPALDLVGHRTPQFFVQREGADMRKEVAGLARMADDYADDTGFVIFPEGGLVRPKRRARILERLDADRPDLAARARELEHLLPPRLAGASALLDRAPDVTVMVCGHAGFAELTDPKTIWRSVPLRHPVVVRTWRHDPADIPTDAAGRERWLFDAWAEMDRWIGDELDSRK